MILWFHNVSVLRSCSLCRRPHIIFFRRLLMLRGFHAHSSTSQLKCRERTVDAEMTCVDCVRLWLSGDALGFGENSGYKKVVGLSVPGIPWQLIGDWHWDSDGRFGLFILHSHDWGCYICNTEFCFELIETLKWLKWIHVPMFDNRSRCTGNKCPLDILGGGLKLQLIRMVIFLTMPNHPREVPKEIRFFGCPNETSEFWVIC